MLASLLACYGAHGKREADRYAAWAAALQQLRREGAPGPPPGLPQLRNYLSDVPQDLRAAALQDLIAEQLRATWQAGPGLLLESCLVEFRNDCAALTSTAVVPAELIEDEFLARYQSPHGDAPSLCEYEQRFPARPDVLELLSQRCLDGGRFVKLHKRGLGGMGAVWEAYDHHSRRRVAIKEPRAGLADQSEALRHFAEETRVTAGLEHPGIAALRECHPADGGAPFYLMRLVSGESLTARIRHYHQPPVGRTPSEQRLLWRGLLQSFVKVCGAMTHAHARGVLHRDLKPGNVVVEESGDAVILDWGMARRTGAHDATSAGIVAGTPDYMPPEQADGLADVRSDVFGLSAILYEILTGRSPQGWTDGSRPADWLGRVRQAQFPPPRRLQARTPRALEAICLKALAREPNERYATAAQLATEVRHYLAGEPVSAWRPPLWSRTWRWVRARR